MSRFEYWKECVEIAADECGANLTPEQIEHIAGSVEGWHENYGMAFDSPSSGGCTSNIESELRAKLKAAQDETEKIRDNFIKNVCARRGCHPSDVILEDDGRVTIRS